jgi:hypothetical protein
MRYLDPCISVLIIPYVLCIIYSVPNINRQFGHISNTNIMLIAPLTSCIVHLCMHFRNSSCRFMKVA